MTYDESEILQPYIDSALSGKQLQEKIYAEKIRLLLRNSYISIFAVIFLSTLLIAGFYHSSTFDYLTIWYTVVITISLLRIGLIVAYKFLPQYINTHLILFLLGTLLSNLCWGVMGSFLMPYDNQLAQMIIVFILAGLASGGVQTLQPSLIACLSCVFALIVPLCFWLFIQQGFEYFILGIATSSYLLFMSIIAIRGNHILTKTLTLQYENLMLVEDISISSKVLKENYTLLKNHEQDITLINQINETLQLCQNSAEIYEVITKAAKKLFVGVNGGLSITIDKHNQEMVSHWGDLKILQQVFPSMNCWAFRSGDKHEINDFRQALICKHYTSLPLGSYLCIPLIVNNNIIGILNFNFPERFEKTNYILEKITTFTNTIKLSLQKNKILMQLHDAAIHDDLTGLFNRHYLNEILPREIQLAKREKSTLCVAMLGIDNFKKLVDEYSPDAGEQVLRFFGHYLKKTFRGSDIVCRFEGEKFLLVLVNTDIHKVITRLEEVRVMLSKENIHYRALTLPKITVSISVVQVPKQNANADDIIRIVNKILTEAQLTGSDKIVQ